MIQTTRDYSKELVMEILKKYKENELARFKELADYYDGVTAITQRELEASKPNTKAVLNYPGYIVDIIKGYFLGKPISYSSQEKDLLEEVQDIFNLNDEQEENSELASIMGTKGIAYELLFADEDSRVRFEEIEPDSAFIVYDSKIIPQPLFGVRFYMIEETEFIEVYTDKEIHSWEIIDGEVANEESKGHYFGGVPLIAYENNKKNTADFEKVISLIDAMEIATSNSINDLEYFSDAYMYLVGMMGTEPEDIENIREQRMILLEEAGEAGFLVKPSNNADSENVKNRLNDAIHKFSFTPDMSDENFASNASGVAMEYKHFGLDQTVINKERKFKTGLYKRLELICNFINTMSGSFKYDYRDIKLDFERNKPVNEKERAEIAQILKGIISDQSTIAYLSDDPQDEMERIANEKDAYSYGNDFEDDETIEPDDIEED